PKAWGFCCARNTEITRCIDNPMPKAWGFCCARNTEIVRCNDDPMPKTWGFAVRETQKLRVVK
ncbi:hypothetical protein, partial [Yersinia pestis]